MLRNLFNSLPIPFNSLAENDLKALLMIVTDSSQSIPLNSETSTDRLTLNVAVQERLRQYNDWTGITFFAFETTQSIVLHSDSNSPQLLVIPQIKENLTEFSLLQTISVNEHLSFVTIPIEKELSPNIVAIGYVFHSKEKESTDLVMAAAAAGWSQEEYSQWVDSIPVCSKKMLLAMIMLLSDRYHFDTVQNDLKQNITSLDAQLARNNDEISILHNLTCNFNFSNGPTDLAKICLEGLNQLVPAESHLIWFTDSVLDGSLITQGTLPFDGLGFARLLAHFENHDWFHPLITNQIEGSLLGSDFPNLQNFILTPIKGVSQNIGWLFICNLKNNAQFDSSHYRLMNSLAIKLATNLHNIQLYDDNQQLMLGFVQSLVSTLDAKDPYTRGHSERVALIGRRLGKEMGLPEDDLEAIYMSGLLHDIGKIGIDDNVLQKPDVLDDDERDQIKKHPLIGYTILKDIKHLSAVLPGVRSHHEAYNGTGYPDQLKGEDIPLMARIMAVADSYDAMLSDRAYRPGMPLEKVESILRHGSGTQWDEKVIDVYFKAREEIALICQNYSGEKSFLARSSQIKCTHGRCI